jgi:hypothetical protein
MFDLERFIDDVRRARYEPEPERAIREVLSAAMSNPAAALDALGEASGAAIGKLHAAPDLTIPSGGEGGWRLPDRQELPALCRRQPCLNWD